MDCCLSSIPRNSADSQTLGQKTFAATKQGLTWVSQAKDDPVAFTHIWKVVINALTICWESRAALMKSPLGGVIAFVEGTQFITDIDKVVSGELFTKPLAEMAEMVVLAVSNVFVTFEWVIRLGFFAASEATAALVVNIGLGTAAIGFAINAARHVGALASLDRKDFKKQEDFVNHALKELVNVIASSVGAVFFTYSMIFAASTAMSALAIATSLAGIANYLFQRKLDDAKEKGMSEEELNKKNIEDLRDPKRYSIIHRISSLVNQSEGLERLARFVAKIFKGCKGALAAFVEDAKIYEEFHDILYLPKRIKEYMSSNPKNDSQSLPGTWSVWKHLNQISMTLMAGLKTVALGIRYQIILLPTIAAATIANVSVLTTSIMVSVVAFAFFAFVEGCRQMGFIKIGATAGSNNTPIPIQIEIAQERVEKWTKLVNQCKDPKIAELIEAKRAKRIDKLEHPNQLNKKKKIWPKEIEAVKKMTVEEFAKATLEKRIRRLKHRESEKVKTILGLFNDSCRAISVSCNLALMYAFTASIISFGSTVIGIASSTFALSKFFYSDAHKSKPKHLSYTEALEQIA